MSPSTPPRTNLPANTPEASRKRKANSKKLAILAERNAAQKRVREATAEWHSVLKSKKENENARNYGHYFNKYNQMLIQLHKNILKARRRLKALSAR
jgi:hypothetical protein